MYQTLFPFDQISQPTTTLPVPEFSAEDQKAMEEMVAQFQKDVAEARNIPEDQIIDHLQQEYEKDMMKIDNAQNQIEQQISDEELRENNQNRFAKDEIQKEILAIQTNHENMVENLHPNHPDEIHEHVESVDNFLKNLESASTDDIFNQLGLGNVNSNGERVQTNDFESEESSLDNQQVDYQAIAENKRIHDDNQFPKKLQPMIPQRERQVNQPSKIDLLKQKLAALHREDDLAQQRAQQRQRDEIQRKTLLLSEAQFKESLNKPVTEPVFNDYEAQQKLAVAAREVDEMTQEMNFIAKNGVHGEEALQRIEEAKETDEPEVDCNSMGSAVARAACRRSHRGHTRGKPGPKPVSGIASGTNGSGNSLLMTPDSQAHNNFGSNSDLQNEHENAGAGVALKQLMEKELGEDDGSAAYMHMAIRYLEEGILSNLPQDLSYYLAMTTSELKHSELTPEQKAAVRRYKHLEDRLEKNPHALGKHAQDQSLDSKIADYGNRNTGESDYSLEGLDIPVELQPIEDQQPSLPSIPQRSRPSSSLLLNDQNSASHVNFGFNESEEQEEHGGGGREFLKQHIQSSTTEDGKVDLNASVAALEAILKAVPNIDEYYAMDASDLRHSDLSVEQKAAIRKLKHFKERLSKNHHTHAIDRSAI